MSSLAARERQIHAVCAKLTRTRIGRETFDLLRTAATLSDEQQ